MSHRHRRYSKRELLGSLHVDYIMSVTDLGLAARTNRWDVLRAFLAAGEARAERLVEEEDGFLWLRFDLKEDTLNGNDFQIALRVYRLLDLIGGKRRKSHRRHVPRNHPVVPGPELGLSAPALAVAAC
jgi:hypothetical protein